MKSIVIETSIPHRCLKPNARTHWRVVAKFKKIARETARIDALAAMNGAEAPRWTVATCGLWFQFTRKHGGGHDGDNLLAWAKSIVDGLADAGIVSNDRGLTHLPPIVEYGAECERLIVTVTGVDN